MADDDRRSEQFIREVHEEYRREQLSTLWQRFGWIVIGVCVLVVLITAGYRGWIWWQEREAARYGDAYLSAVEQLDSGNRDEAEAALADLAEEGSEGYRVLARLQLAVAREEAGDPQAALASFDAIAEDADAPDPIRSLARIRGALIALDGGDLDAASERAAPLAIAGNPWRHMAREVIGIVGYEKGEYEEARQAFAAIQEDAEASQSLRERANMMMALLDSQMPPPAAGDTAASGAEPEAPPAAAQQPVPGAPAEVDSAQ